MNTGPGGGTYGVSSSKDFARDMRASLGESCSCDAAVPTASVTTRPARNDVFIATLLYQVLNCGRNWGHRSDLSNSKSSPASGTLAPPRFFEGRVNQLFDIGDHVFHALTPQPTCAAANQQGGRYCSGSPGKLLNHLVGTGE